MVNIAITYLVDELINDVPEPMIRQLKVNWVVRIWCEMVNIAITYLLDELINDVPEPLIG